MIGQDVTISVDGSAMDTYVTRPHDDGVRRHPAVIVLQEVFGINQEMRRITDLVASAGYVGCAINFYHRTHPNLNLAYDTESMQTGIAAARQITRASLRRDVEAAIAWLNEQPYVSTGKIATWGFCMGGTAAFLSATYPEINAAISFYGGSIAKPMLGGEGPALELADQIRAPILLCFGAEDQGISPADVDRIKQELESHGKRFRVQVYPGVGHAFFRHGTARAVGQQDRFSDEAVAQAVADAWDSVQAFLADAFNAAQTPEGASAESRTAHRS